MVTGATGDASLFVRTDTQVECDSFPSPSSSDDDDSSDDDIDPSTGFFRYIRRQSLEGRLTKSTSIVNDNESLRNAINAYGLRCSTQDKLSKYKDVHCVLLDVSVLCQVDLSSKKAKPTKPVDVPPTVIKVKVRAATVLKAKSAGVYETESSDAAHSITLYFPLTIDSEFESPSLTIDNFRIQVLGELLKVPNDRLVIGKKSGMFVADLHGRKSMTAMKSTKDLLKAIVSGKASVKSRSFIDGGTTTSADLVISFAQKVQSDSPVDEAFVTKLKGTTGYKSLKVWLASKQTAGLLPSGVVRASSASAVAPSSPQVAFSQSDTFLPSEITKSSVSSLNTNLIHANIGAIVLNLNKNPASCYYQGISTTAADVMRRFIFASKSNHEFIVSALFREGSVTEADLKDKRWYIDWTSKLYYDQVSGLIPEKNKYPTAQGEDYASVKPANSRGGRGSSARDDESRSSLVDMIAAKLVGDGGASSLAPASMLSIRREFNVDTHPNNTPRPHEVSVQLDLGDVATINTHIGLVEEEDYNNLFQVGVLDITKEVDLRYAIVLKKNGDSEVATRRIYTEKQASSVLMKSIAFDAGVAQPITMYVVVTKKVTSVPANNVYKRNMGAGPSGN